MSEPSESSEPNASSAPSASNEPRAPRAARRTSVWVLPLETGGCGACLQSIYALLAPQYASQLRAHGISFARSPRHADVLLAAGALTAAAREPAQRLVQSVPQPRALVAVGNCAIDGCVFAGSPVLVKSAADALDAHVEIAGCPPAPSAILAAILEAGQLLAGEDEVDEDEADEPADEAEGEAEEDGEITRDGEGGGA